MLTFVLSNEKEESVQWRVEGGEGCKKKGGGEGAEEKEEEEEKKTNKSK